VRYLTGAPTNCGFRIAEWGRRFADAARLRTIRIPQSLGSVAQPADAAASRAVDPSRDRLEVQLLPEPPAGLVAQPADAPCSERGGCGFESHRVHQNFAEERQRRPRLAHTQELAGSSPASATPGSYNSRMSRSHRDDGGAIPSLGTKSFAAVVDLVDTPG
jgi:hypothetical protein